MKTVLLAAALLAAAASSAGAAVLSDLRWQKRVLILFAPGETPSLARQRSLLAGSEAALAERDIVVFAVLGGERILPVYGEAPTQEGAADLARRYDVAAETPFAAVLIGKDGGVKWRAASPVDPRELNDVIDAMPMRRGGD